MDCSDESLPPCLSEPNNPLREDPLWSVRHPLTPEHKSDLPVLCPRCHGTGEIGSWGWGTECPACHGTGEIAESLARQLFRLAWELGATTDGEGL